MEHYIFYCKLSLLAVLSLITACCMLSRRWYVNLAAFLACLSGETFLAHLFFPGYMLCPAAASPSVPLLPGHAFVTAATIAIVSRNNTPTVNTICSSI